MSVNVAINAVPSGYVYITHEPSLPEKAKEDSSNIDPIWFVDFVSEEAMTAGAGKLRPYMQSVLEQRSWALYESWNKVYEGGEDDDDDNKKLSPAEKRCAWAVDEMLERYSKMSFNKSKDEWEGSGFCKTGERTYERDFLNQILECFVDDAIAFKEDLEPMLTSLAKTNTMKMVVLQKYDYDAGKKTITSECKTIGFRFGLQTVDGSYVEWMGSFYDYDQEQWAKMGKEIKADKKKDMQDLMDNTTLRCDL